MSQMIDFLAAAGDADGVATVLAYSVGFAATYAQGHDGNFYAFGINEPVWRGGRVTGSMGGRVVRTDDARGVTLYPAPKLVCVGKGIENYAPFFDPSVSDLDATRGVTDVGSPVNWVGMCNKQLQFTVVDTAIYAYEKVNVTVGEHLICACFVQMEDGSKPKIGGGTEPVDLSVIVRGSNASDTVIHIKDDIYLVVGYNIADQTALENFGITAYTTQSKKPFKVTGFQVFKGYTLDDIYDLPPIITTGTPQNVSEKVYVYSEANHIDSYGLYCLDFFHGGADAEILVKGGPAFLKIVNGDLILTDGTNQVFAPILVGEHKVAFAYDAIEGIMELNLDGAWYS